MNLKSPLAFPQIDRENMFGSFIPLSPSNRNELLSWASTGALAVAGYFIFTRTGSLSWFHSLFLGVCFVVSAAISLANWLDRNTQIKTSTEGLEYHSPLRRCQMSWQTLDIVRILPFDRGLRIYVQAGNDHFTYRTDKPENKESERRQTGTIQNGNILTAQILANSNFSEPVWMDGYWEYCSEEVISNEKENSGTV